jgi:hypothetical protein
MEFKNIFFPQLYVPILTKIVQSFMQIKLLMVSNQLLLLLFSVTSLNFKQPRFPSRQQTLIRNSK